MNNRIRKLVEHCDLEERLQSVPPSARFRGLYFKNTEGVLDRAGLLGRYREYYPEKYSAIRWYPSGDFLERLAVAAALLASPETIHEGMRAIGYHNATTFAASLLGRTMLKLLAHDPVKLFKQGSAARRQSCTYGRWEIDFPERNIAVMTMFEEYLWIESYLLGAAEGTLESAGRKGSVTLELNSKFEGKHIIRWS